MPVIKHVHKDDCPKYDHKEWVCHIAPDVLWFDIQDVGSYQGSVYGVGLYENQFVLYEDYYGSCSGCGAWGDGGEPESQKDVLSKSRLFKEKDEILEAIAKIDSYDTPDVEKMFEAVKEIDRKWLKR